MMINPVGACLYTQASSEFVKKCPELTLSVLCLAAHTGNEQRCNPKSSAVEVKCVSLLQTRRTAVSDLKVCSPHLPRASYP